MVVTWSFGDRTSSGRAGFADHRQQPDDSLRRLVIFQLRVRRVYDELTNGSASTISKLFPKFLDAPRDPRDPRDPKEPQGTWG